MKHIIATITIVLSGVLFSAAQVAPSNLSGYWLEKESPDQLSLSTLMVFNLNSAGEMEGVIYFMDSDDSNQEFRLSNIRIDGNDISFHIGQTTISFLGEVDPKSAAFSGVFYLDEGVTVEVKHQKLDEKSINSLENSRRYVPKKQIDHTDGVLIG
jgi:hypothetical protein